MEQVDGTSGKNERMEQVVGAGG